MPLRLLAALLLLAGCAQPPPEESEEATPPPGWGVDDDDAGPVVPSYDHPPRWGDEPFDPDDPDGLSPCELEEVLGAGCEALEHRHYESRIVGCEPGVHRFGDAAAWAGFLLDCGHDGADPAEAVEWDAEELLVYSGRGEGCGLATEPLWLASCEEGPALGLYFYLCGECSDVLEGQLMVPVPADWPAVEVVECIPVRIRCGT